MLVEEVPFERSKGTFHKRHRRFATEATRKRLGAIIIDEPRSYKFNHSSAPSNERIGRSFRRIDVGYRLLDNDRPLIRIFRGTDVSLQIFLVCHQVYHEASYIFYSKNRFYFRKWVNFEASRTTGSHLPESSSEIYPYQCRTGGKILVLRTTRRGGTARRDSALQ